MGCMLRSDLMTFCEMYIQPEAAFEIMSMLGEKGCAQFDDMTPDMNAFQRNYIPEFCRSAELERILRFMEEEIKKEKLPMLPLKEEPSALHPNVVNQFEAMLEKWEDGLHVMSAYQTKLLQSLLELKEMRSILQDMEPILGNAQLTDKKTAQSQGPAGEALGGHLYIHTGVVRRSKCYAFETMAWRVSRGNVFFRPSAEDHVFEDPHSGTLYRKVAFVAICQGESLNSVLLKIIQGFHANLYPCPGTSAERSDMIMKLDSRISDLNQVILKSKYHRCKQLRMISKQWEAWLIQVKKSKSIYHNLNLFSKDISKKCLIGRCWIPTSDLKDVHEILKKASSASGSKVSSFMSKGDTIATPPTFHRTNKFTYGFQNLISAYGDSLYRELNPGLYTLITFPFLFAVMFGDSGHATIMLSFAIWMLKNEKKFMSERSTNEIWNIFFGGRYVMLMMGLFSMYTGFLYNDWFSKPLRLKENYWINTFTAEELEHNESLPLDPSGKTKSLYVIGVDPCWMFAKNKIMNENSLKMKMSIILGIVHMMFGLWLSLFNHLYFKKYYAIILEFLPQLLFLTCLFVWLVFLIFFKWIKYGPKQTDIKLQPGCAPLILILFIDMCLMRTTAVDEGSVCDPYMFDGQATIQKVLLVFALVNVPILLFGSPVYILKSNKLKLAVAQRDLDNYLSKKPKEKTGEETVDETLQILTERVHHYSESFGELMIHQGVHTIEYVLSTISHTASYLRLWALSLAHAQLSEMLWGMVFSKLALQDHSTIAFLKVYIVFALWASFSVSILVVMEGLSAFLHTLRLHWVEFMSKFYTGNGIIFRPFAFSDLIEGENKEEKAIQGACSKKRPAAPIMT